MQPCCATHSVECHGWYIFLDLVYCAVKEQGPRIMGWRRPCFGEAPLSRFRAKQDLSVWCGVVTRMFLQMPVPHLWHSGGHQPITATDLGEGKLTVLAGA